MHFEILVEDQSGKRLLDILIPKIIGDQHTFRVIDYQGIGRIPRNLTSSADARNRLLLKSASSVAQRVWEHICQLSSSSDSGLRP